MRNQLKFSSVQRKIAGVLHNFIICLTVIIGIQPLQAERLPPKTLDSLKITAVVLRDMQPNTLFNSRTGKISGFTIDLTNLVFDQTPYDVEFLVVDQWAQAEQALLQGIADFCPVMAINEQRKQMFLFTNPVETFYISICTRSQKRDIHNISSLVGQEVGVVKASQALRLLQHIKGIHVTEYNSFQDAIYDLLIGHIDAFVAPEFIINSISHEAGLEKSIKIVGDPLKELKRGFAFTPEKQWLYDQVAPLIHPTISSAEYKEIYKYWFISHDGYWTVKRVVLWLSTLFVSILLVVAIFYYRSLLKVNTQLKNSIAEKDATGLKLKESLRRIQEINSHLEETKEKAVESDKLKTAFLANLSHEIRTPMNGILGFAGLLQKKNLSASSHQKYITIIEQSGQRLISLIDDLVDISKIEAGQVELIVKSTDLNQLMRGLNHFYSLQAKLKGLDINCMVCDLPKAMMAMLDGIKIEQILVNLINNALKFTNEGSISFGYTIQEKDLLFTVRDSGKGIPENMTETIFERFRQADHSYLSGVEGSGLGLAICKSYVELMGGKIWVESELNVGSTFKFKIPYEPVEKTKDATMPEVVTQKKEGLTILLVEDDPISYEYMNIILTDSNHKMLWAANGEEGLAMFMAYSEIELILMDMKMPIMDGITACTKIREKNKDIPIIMQSAFASNTDIQNAFDAGCTDYLTKPVNSDELFAKINQVLENR